MCYTDTVKKRLSRGAFSFTVRRGGTNKPRTMREAVIGGAAAKMWEPSGLFLPGGGRVHQGQRREPGRKKSPLRGFQLMQNRRHVVALVKAAATSGRAFFKAAVSILLLVTGFQVTL